MAQQVEFTLDAKEAGAVRAWLAVERAANQFNSSLQTIDNSQQQAQKSAAEWGAKARRVLAELETPQERHNRKLAEYSKMRQLNLIDENKYAAAVKRSREELDGATVAGGKAGDMVAGFGMKVAGLATSIASVATVASILKNEYDDLLKRQGKAAETQITLAQAQRMAVFNLSGDATLSPNQMVQEVKGISSRTGVDETSVTRLLSDMFSARGDKSARDVLPYAENVLRMAPDISGQPMMGGATLDLAKTFGANPEQAFGMMMQVGAASRVTDLNSLAQNVVPAMVSMSPFGDNAEQAGELVATLTQASADKTGASSSTAAVQLAGRLNKLLPELKNSSDRIAAVRSDKSLQEKLFKEDFGEERFKPLFRQLLTGDETSPTVKAYRGAQSTVGGLDAGAALAEELRKSFEGLPTAKTAAVGRNLGSLAERLRSTDDFGGKSGVSRKGLADVLEAANVPEMTRKIILTRFDAQSQIGGIAPIDAAASAMEEQSRNALNPYDLRASGFERIPGETVRTPRMIEVPRAPTPQESQLGTALSEVAKSLRDLQRSMDQNTKATDKASDSPSQKPNVTPPAPVASSLNDSRIKTGRP